MANELTHMLTTDEVNGIRQYVTHGDGPARQQVVELMGPRVFLPIEEAAGSGRASCRGCGVTIGRGEICVAFGFDPRATLPGVSSQWGRLARAYLHRRCPGERRGS